MATTSAPVELGTRFRTIQSQVSSIPFDSGNTRSVELPRSFLYKMLRIRLRGSINTGGSAATPLNESPLGLIKRMDIIADGRKILYSTSGQDGWHLSNIFQGKAGELVGPSTSSGTVRPFSSTYYVHHEAARMLTPIMSYFDPRPYEKVECRTQWGTVSDMLATTTGTTVN